MEERRQTPRSRTLKAARIVFQSGTRVYDCQIRNISAQGGLLKVPSTHDIPSEFLLYIDKDQIRRPARVIWRKADEIGIEFTGPAEPIR